ncbi:hypothetical protein PspTeo4_43016 [Pseudomonas sp. Teo4]|nr:hypothetical protein [Pseudomonas sp. Teo4]
MANVVFGDWQVGVFRIGDYGKFFECNFGKGVQEDFFLVVGFLCVIDWDCFWVRLWSTSVDNEYVPLIRWLSQTIGSHTVLRCVIEGGNHSSL